MENILAICFALVIKSFEYVNVRGLCICYFLYHIIVYTHFQYDQCVARLFKYIRKSKMTAQNCSHWNSSIIKLSSGYNNMYECSTIQFSHHTFNVFDVTLSLYHLSPLPFNFIIEFLFSLLRFTFSFITLTLSISFRYFAIQFSSGISIYLYSIYTLL